MIARADTEECLLNLASRIQGLNKELGTGGRHAGGA
jgi:hypothetical protein